jgi:DUF4097 and DUF4098 domain-containing protein YvlB
MKEKNRLLSYAVLFTAGFMICFSMLAASEREKYEEKFDETVALAKDGRVVLGNIAGNIEVRTWNKGEVKIKALKVSRASTESRARQNADLVTIEIEKSNSMVEIKTVYPKRSPRKMNVSVSFDLYIPAKASAKISSVSGSINVSKIGGDCRVSTVSGEVILEDIMEYAKANSVSGDVELKNAGQGAHCESVSGNVSAQDVVGDVFLKTVSGNVYARNVEGSIEGSTVSGGVDLKNVEKADSIRASTLSGSVNYVGEILSDGRYYFKSHSGSITLHIPSDSAFDLEAKTFSGSIRSDFDIMISGKISKKELRGSVNGGGAEVEAKTFSGSIYLEKK